jgi:hypothetical protein
VEIHPQYQDFLNHLGIKDAEDFLSLPAIIVSGHPDRNVARVKLGSGPSLITGYLKREHCLPWRDRLTNAWAGFGWCSKSYREGLLVRAMRKEGVSVPEFLAAGEDGRGRAFLLVRELSESVELRDFLLAGHPPDSVVRSRFARELGETLARLHDTGFDHPDLYSKHVLVNPRRWGVSLLDCQRTQRHQNLPWRRRWRDLAALDATLTEDLVPPRERLRCLRSYLIGALGTRAPKAFFRKAAASVRRRASRMLRHRHVRELRQPPLGPEAQNLIWVRGEMVCVTREFHDALKGQIPVRLLLGRRRPLQSWTWRLSESQVDCCRYAFRGIGKVLLIRHQARRPFHWLWAKVCRHRLVSPELEQAGIIFRLERYGVPCARVLAFGQTQFRFWQFQSFLLVQDRTHGMTPSQWMAEHKDTHWTAQRKQRWRLIRDVGSMLRQMHQAQCYLPSQPDESLIVENTVEGGPTLILAHAQDVRKRRHPSQVLAKKNLRSLVQALGTLNLSRTDRMRFLLSYSGQKRFTALAKKLAGDVML